MTYPLLIITQSYRLNSLSLHYFELASEPKQIAWYENCNHELSAQARLDRAIFLCEQLGLPCPSQQVLDLLERVPPPCQSVREPKEERKTVKLCFSAV